MEIEAFIKKGKEFYTPLLNFFESESIYEDEIQELTKIFDDQDIFNNPIEMYGLLELLFNIGNNHHQTTDFFKKLGLIFHYLIKDKQLPISSAEIFDLYKTNKRLLLFLFEQKVLQPEKSIYNTLMQERAINGYKLYYYLFVEIKKFFGKRKSKSD